MTPRSAAPPARRAQRSGGIPPATIQSSASVPKRAVLAIIGTVIALVLLVSFRTPDVVPAAGGGLSSAPPLTANGPSEVAGVAGVGSAAPSAAPTQRPTASSAPATVPAATADRGGPAATRRPTATARRTATPAPTPPPTPRPTAAANADVPGPVENTPYGAVQVEVKLSGGRIVDVVALQLPSDRQRSQQISSYVAPILHDEALQAQSAQIDLISGATWTSGGYQASLQAALAAVHG